MIEIKSEKNREYQFIVQSKKGHVLLQSEPFGSQDAAALALQKAQDLMQVNKGVERRTEPNGKFLFVLRDGQCVLAKSRFYDSEAGMENAIKNVQKLMIDPNH